MPIQYKVNIMDELKKAGYTTYKIRQEKIIGERALQQIRKGELCSWAVLSKVCELLQCQPGILLEYVEENKYEKLGFTKIEVSELRKLIQLIPENKADELLPSIIELIRTDDWYDLSDDEHRERFRELLSKDNPGDKQLY